MASTIKTKNIDHGVLMVSEGGHVAGLTFKPHHTMEDHLFFDAWYMRFRVHYNLSEEAAYRAYEVIGDWLEKRGYFEDQDSEEKETAE